MPVVKWKSELHFAVKYEGIFRAKACE